MNNLSAVTNAAGPHAQMTAQLFWLYMGIFALIFCLVIGFLFLSLWRRCEARTIAPLELAPPGEKRLRVAVGTCIAATIIILTGLLGLSYNVDHHLIGLDRDPALAIEVTGHQWWWEVRYPDPIPSNVFTTANEIHVPVGVKVRLILKSDDVIHSLWLPNLAGKRDMIPGHDADLVIRADRAGTWQGRCAEFCGLQHAFMGLKVIAEPKAAFDAWELAQRQPAPLPANAEQLYGHDIFTKGACAMCHTIRGTESTGYSMTAPDLTHLMSRTSIAAGAAPNNPDILRQWINDPHSIKPGVHMPAIAMKPDDMKALIAYLETLK